MGRPSILGKLIFPFQAVLGSLYIYTPLIFGNMLQAFMLLRHCRAIDRFRAFNTAGTARVLGWWVWFIDRVVGLKLTITGDVVPPHENALVIANHQCMSDIVLILFLAHKARMAGHIKWVAKNILKYIPGFGWGMQFLECIFIKRNWEQDQRIIERGFTHLSSLQMPLWLLSFPEGTRFSKSKHQAQKERRELTSEKPHSYSHLLMPHHRGFISSVQLLKTHVKAVYVLAIKYYGPPPGLITLIAGDSPTAELNVRRIPIESLPQDHVALAQWLDQEFLRMDTHLERMNLSSKPAAAAV